MNTNIDGKQKVVYALTKVKGCGRRYANIVCKKADIDLNMRYVYTTTSDCTTISEETIRSQDFQDCRPNFRHNANSSSAGELSAEQLERIVSILQSPTQYKIPSWFLNRQRDIVDGKDSQVLANGVDSKLREDLERLKKIRCHRGLRHYWGLRVRGQHTKTTGRRGRTVGVSKKKGG